MEFFLIMLAVAALIVWLVFDDDDGPGTMRLA